MGKVSEAPAEACSKVWWCSSSDMMPVVNLPPKGVYVLLTDGGARGTDAAKQASKKVLTGEEALSGFLMRWLGPS
jgi:hypothetical protein